MTDLRAIFTTKEKMTSLRDIVKKTFTAGNTASFLSNIITDSKLNEQLQKAIGSKKDKPFKSRAADTITASLLGFNNANEMHAFYDKARENLFIKETYFHTHRHGDDAYEVYVEQGVFFTPLDAIAIQNYEFDLSRDEEMTWVSSSDTPCALIDVPRNSDVIKSTDDVAAMMFDLIPADFSDEQYLPTMEGDNVEANLETLEDYINQAATGMPLSRDWEMNLGLYRDNEYEFLSIPLSLMTSKQALLQYLLDFEDDCFAKDLTKNIDFGLIATSTNIPNTGSIELNSAYEVFYDLEKQVLIVAKHKQPIMGMGFHVSRQDVRAASFFELLKA